MSAGMKMFCLGLFVGITTAVEVIFVIGLVLTFL